VTVGPPPEQQPQVQIKFPEDRAAGDYANGLNIGVNQHELVVDYLVNVDGPGMPPTVELVRRLRLPIAMAGDLLSGVAGAMDAYENTFGPIHRPGIQS
jgi:hypothetical protein